MSGAAIRPSIRPSIRLGRDDDARDIIALVGGCWAEYPGCVMDLDGEVPELRALASYYAGPGGALWAAEAAGRLVGIVGTRPLGEDALGENVWEICKMYVERAQRGGGIAVALLAAAEAFARAHGATEMKLWSDTRFERAHRFYEKHSYVRHGPIRVLGDRSNSIEFGYLKPLGPAARPLDVAAVASAASRLAAVASDCGLPPPAALPATVAEGRSVVLAAWDDGVLVGWAEVTRDPEPDRRHRATLRRIMVMRHARRRGLARRLVAAADEAAGRPLLVAEVRADEAAPLAALGWQEAGRLRGGALGAGDSPLDTVWLSHRG